MKEFFKKPSNVIWSIAALVIVVYFGIKIYRELRPQTYQEKRMHCLELGSNFRAEECFRLIN